MFDRKHFKENAKNILKTSYWKAFLVSLLSFFLAGHSGFALSFNSGIANFLFLSDFGNDIGIPTLYDYPGIATFLSLVLLFVIVFFAIVFILQIFILNPLLIGCKKYFVFASKGDTSLSYIGNGFKKQSYANIMLTMFLTNMYLFLWTMLFVLPGIFKVYSYRMVPYILAENPNMKPGKAIKLSREITKGYKWKLFVLDLSFIGLFLLGSLALGVGIVFVYPYYFQTVAQSYIYLRYGDQIPKSEQKDLEYIVEV